MTRFTLLARKTTEGRRGDKRQVDTTGKEYFNEGCGTFPNSHGDLVQFWRTAALM